jgi:DNA topoisomerase-1
LGQDENGLDVTIRNGRFGPYVQRGEATEENPKPGRASLPKTWAPDALVLDRALELLGLPRVIGPHPEDGALVEAAIGRFGPYVKHGPVYANLPDLEEVFSIGMNRAVEVLALKLAGRRGSAAAVEPLREMGEHPSGGAMQIMPGKYGPYVKWGKINATVPKDIAPEDLTVEQALELIAEKAGKSGKKPAARKAAPKTAAAKATAKPAAKKPAAAKAKTVKKPAAKKPAVKKTAPAAP